MEALIIKSIVEQHAEEAAFLWLQRELAIGRPHYNLKGLAQLDDRVEAHIDGLRISGDAGWEMCKEALDDFKQPGEVFAAALLAFEGDDGQRVDEVLKVALEAPENWRALISALGWLSDEDYQRWVPGLLTANDLSYRRLAIAASVIHRQDSATALAAALDDPEPDFQARALRAVGELKRRDLLPVLQKFTSDDPACQFWATWSAVLLGDKAALNNLNTFVTADSAFLEQALQIMLRLMDVPNSTKWLSDFTQGPEVLRHAVLGAGIIGDPMYIPWLINLMTVPEVSRVAGEAFSMITGVDLAYDNLEGEWPEGFEAGPTENPADEDVAMDSDEDLPWPEPNLIQAWWEKNKNQFRTGVRYLVGKPITVEHCQQILNTGSQRQRRAAALELALLQKDEPLFNTSAPGFRQQQLLRQAV